MNITERDLLNRINNFMEESFEEFFAKFDKNNIPTYKRGDKFLHMKDSGETEEYILACINERREMQLINLSDGNRWSDAVQVKDPHKITWDEFNELTGDPYKFTKIEED